MTSLLHKIIFLIALLLLPTGSILAAGFVELVGVPGLQPDDYNSMGKYLNALYVLAIGIGAVLAVLRIIFAGAKYMFTDIVTSKGEAKTEIRNVLLGLLIVIGAVLILNTINPNLKNLDALSNLNPTEVQLKKVEETTSQSVYSGPTSCAAGQSLTIKVTDSGIVRSCIENSKNPALGNMPTEADLLPGEKLTEIVINIPCGNPTGCNLPNSLDNTQGIASAEASCDSRSGGRGIFTPTDNVKGICSWPE